MLKFKGYKISCTSGCDFTAESNTHSIRFIAEYKNGNYSHIVSVYDKNTNRVYKAHRYFYPFYTLVSEFTYELLKNGMLKDYKNNCNALVTYKKDIESYYRECKKLHLSTSEFLDNLFAE